MKSLLTTACALAIAAPAFAGQIMSDPKDGKKTIMEPCPPVDRFTLEIDSSYVFESDFKDRKNDSGSAYSGNIDFGYRIPLGEGWPNVHCGTWNLRVGAHYSRHDFGNSGNVPIPNHIHALSGVVALEYLVDGKTGIIIETRPGVYFENDISSDNFDAPTFAVFAHRFTPSFTGVIGAAYGQFRKYPILPVVGFIWDINESWTVNAIYPKAQVLYKVSDSAKVYFGGEYVGDSVRVDDAKGRSSRLDNAVLSYSEYRGTVGFQYTTGNFTADLSGGWAFERKFDYHRAGRDFKTEGAPFVELALKAAF